MVAHDARCSVLWRKEHSAWRIAFRPIIQKFKIIQTLGPMPCIICPLSSDICFSAFRLSLHSTFHIPHSKSSVICLLTSDLSHLSSDSLSQAALAFSVLLSPPGSTFPVEDGGVPRKRAILSSNGGWVENKLIKLLPDNGLTINMWAVDGLASMGNCFALC